MSTTATSYPSMDDGIEIRVITMEDKEKVIEFMITHFSPDEPLTIGCEPKDESILSADLMLAYIDFGMCLKAVVKETDEIVGITITGPKQPTQIQDMYAAASKEGNTKYVKILKFLSEMERSADLYNRYKVEKVIYVIATSVAKCWRGKNIGARLYNGVDELGKEKGYELLTSDCSSFYSAQIKIRLGWDCVHTVYYKDYLDEDNKPVFTPPQPHVCCKTCAKRL